MHVSTDVTCLGTGERVVESYLINAGHPGERRPETVKVAPGQAAPLEFIVRQLDQGTRQGYLRIVGEDGLGNDDIRYFTADVRAAWKILVAAPPRPDDQAFFLTQASVPAAFRKTARHGSIVA